MRTGDLDRHMYTFAQGTTIPHPNVLEGRVVAISLMTRPLGLGRFCWGAKTQSRSCGAISDSCGARCLFEAASIIRGLQVTAQKKEKRKKKGVVIGQCSSV